MENCCRAKRCGFSLIEVVIAIAIFSTGLGGLSLLLMMTIQETAASGMRSVAVSQVRSLSGQLMMLPGIPVESIGPMDSPSCLEGASCPPGQMAGAALHQWQQQLAELIPGGSGLVCRDSTPNDGIGGNPSCDGAGGAVVKVFWTEPGTGEDGAVLSQRVVAALPLR